MEQVQQINIDKPTLIKIIEFFHAIRIIQDSRQLIAKEQYYQIIPVYGQLRAILTDKTKERNNERKPFFAISDIVRENLNIFYTPKIIDYQKYIKDQELGMEIESIPISINKENINQEQISLENFLNTDIINYKDRLYKTYEIINALSDKFGGSHYDTKIPAFIKDFWQITDNDLSILDNLILQLADISISLGIKLINKISDFELFVLIKCNLFSKEKNYILDYNLPNSSGRLSLYCLDGKMWVFMGAMVGRSVNIEVNNRIDFDKMFLINIYHQITSDLKSHIKIGVNGITAVDIIINDPLLMLNQTQGYQGFYNRSFDGDCQDFEFGMRELIIYGAALDVDTENQVFKYFSDQKYKEITWINKRSYAHKPPGQSDYKIEGPVETRKIK